VADQLEDSAYIDVNPPDLSVTPSQVSKSAFQGSAATTTEDLTIDNLGTGSPNWTATKSASWLSLSKPGGPGMPDTVTLTLDPAGLAEGIHRDTVVITAPGASGSPAKVPVAYTIDPCATTPFTPDAEIPGALTTSDCGAPHRSGHFAKVYTFAGNGGDVVTLSIGGTFVPYLILTTGAGSVLAESVCPNGVGLACLEEVTLPGPDTYRVEATTQNPADTGSFTLRAVMQNDPSVVPTSLRQWRSDSMTAIPAGGTTTDTVVVLQASVTDTDLGDTLTLEVEVRPSGQVFANTATAYSDPAPGGTGIDIQVRVTGLSDNTGYKWQARAVDKTGGASGWVGFGSDPGFIVDRAPENPDPPTGLGQFESNGSTPISSGGTTNESAVVLKATVSDPDPGDTLRLVVEVRPTGQPFTNFGTDTSASVPGGSEASVTVSGLLDDTDYHWQAWVIDSDGSGGTPDSLPGTPDFSVAVPEPPSAPTGAAQTKTDATPLAVGDTTDENQLIVSATVSDPDPGDQVRLQVEVRPVGTPFTSVPTHTSTAVASGNPASHLVQALDDDTDYHWQFRAIDQDDSTSVWTSFGGNPESEADFHVAVPEDPTIQPLSLGQFRSDGSTPIDTGATTDENRVTLKATVEDPDPGDQIVLEVEVKPFGTAFNGPP
jgi:hypothetical protein